MGAKPAASSSFSRNASELARPAQLGSRSSSASSLESRWYTPLSGSPSSKMRETGLAGARGTVQGAAVLTQLGMRSQGLDRRHGEHVAAALVEHEVQAEERFQAPAEARASLAHAFGDRAHATPGWGIQVEDPVRFAVPDRAKDDSFGFTDPDIALYFLKSYEPDHRLYN